MLALYRAGRQADALEVYRAFRLTLDEELGLEPSAALRELEAAILRQDHGLALPLAPREAPVHVALPGRDAERDQLAAAYADAAAGRRRALFVTGDPGLGKTALVDALLADAVGAWSGRGQCVEGVGAAEAYLPVLDALAELAARAEAAAVLQAVAPSWAVHLGLDVGTRAAGATAQRTVREAAHALEALTEHAPVVVVLEDLQWADEATIELVAALMRRTRPARLLLVGTCRTAAGGAGVLLDAARGGRLGDVIELAPLDFDAVTAMLAERAGADAVSPALAGVLHERSGGNPLFAGLVVDDWLAAGALEIVAGILRPAGDIGELAITVPATIRSALEAQLRRLEPATWRCSRRPPSRATRSPPSRSWPPRT